MNPYFEKEWFQVHPCMIAEAQWQIQTQLPPDLRAVIEQGMTITATRTTPERDVRPDMSVWKLREDTLLASAPPNYAPPLQIALTSPKPRHLSIRQKDGALVTVIEFLSPTNKHSGGAVSYLQKRQALVAQEVNLVEVDLIRKWGLALLQFDGEEWVELMLQKETRMPAHTVNVIRAGSPFERQIYPIDYPSSLPACLIPLRADDSDVWLDLQKAARQCHIQCAFDKSTDYTRDPEPPLSPEDTAWLHAHLKKHELR